MCGLTHPRMKEAILSVAHRETITLKWTNTRFKYFFMFYKKFSELYRERKKLSTVGLEPTPVYTDQNTHYKVYST